MRGIASSRHRFFAASLLRIIGIASRHRFSTSLPDIASRLASRLAGRLPFSTPLLDSLLDAASRFPGRFADQFPGRFASRRRFSIPWSIPWSIRFSTSLLDSLVDSLPDVASQHRFPTRSSTSLLLPDSLVDFASSRSSLSHDHGVVSGLWQESRDCGISRMRQQILERRMGSRWEKLTNVIFNVLFLASFSLFHYFLTLLFIIFFQSSPGFAVGIFFHRPWGRYLPLLLPFLLRLHRLVSHHRRLGLNRRRLALARQLGLTSSLLVSNRSHPSPTKRIRKKMIKTA